MATRKSKSKKQQVTIKDIYNYIINESSDGFCAKSKKDIAIHFGKKGSSGTGFSDSFRKLELGGLIKPCKKNGVSGWAVDVVSSDSEFDRRTSLKIQAEDIDLSQIETINLNGDIYFLNASLARVFGFNSAAFNNANPNSGKIGQYVIMYEKNKYTHINGIEMLLSKLKNKVTEEAINTVISYINTNFNKKIDDNSQSKKEIIANDDNSNLNSENKPEIVDNGNGDSVSESPNQTSGYNSNDSTEAVDKAATTTKDVKDIKTSQKNSLDIESIHTIYKNNKPYFLIKDIGVMIKYSNIHNIYHYAHVKDVEEHTYTLKTVSNSNEKKGLYISIDGLKPLFAKLKNNSSVTKQRQLLKALTEKYQSSFTTEPVIESNDNNDSESIVGSSESNVFVNNDSPIIEKDTQNIESTLNNTALGSQNDVNKDDTINNEMNIIDKSETKEDSVNTSEVISDEVNNNTNVDSEESNISDNNNTEIYSIASEIDNIDLSIVNSLVDGLLNIVTTHNDVTTENKHLIEENQALKNENMSLQNVAIDVEKLSKLEEENKNLKSTIEYLNSRMKEVLPTITKLEQVGILVAKAKNEPPEKVLQMFKTNKNTK